LIIKETQLQRMQEAREPDLHAELMDFLRENSEAARSVSAETLSRAVDFGLERAKPYGFQHHSSLGGFILLMFEVSPYYYTHPRIHQALIDTNIPLERRVESLGLVISEQVWEEAAKLRPGV
jgi:hypothetical protein